MDTTAYESFSELFPMPMTSIEKFHFWDDDPLLPNLIYCRLRVEGRLDADIAKQAWQIAIERQPFGDVEPQKINGRWFWITGPRGKGESHRSIDTWNGTRFEFHEHPAAPSDWKIAEHRIRSATGSYLGISVWPANSQAHSDPVRVSSNTELRSGEHERGLEMSEVWFYVHHAISDGAGAALVVNEWMLIYANLQSGRPPETGIHRLDSTLFGRRNSLGLFGWRYLKHLPKQPIALFGAAKFAFRKTVALVPNVERASDAVSNSGHFPAIIGQWVSESQVVQLSEQAKTHEVTFNSVLLGQLYIALARWRRAQGFHSDRDWMRIILPMSIRNVSDRRLPAANRATIVQIDRCGREMENVGQFYQSLNREVMIIRGFQLDKMFLLVMRGLSVFESFLKRAARNDKSRGMAVFTNLGEPLRKAERAGSREPQSSAYIRPMDFDPSGPIRKGTPVNFSAARYGSRLRISLHYDANVLTLQQANELLETYVDQLDSIE